MISTRTLMIGLLVIVGLVGLLFIALTTVDRNNRVGPAMIFAGVGDVCGAILLGVWFFPRAAKRLESYTLGFFVGLPLFALLMAAIVVFFFSTCLGFLAVTDSF